MLKGNVPSRSGRWQRSDKAQTEKTFFVPERGEGVVSMQGNFLFDTDVPEERRALITKHINEDIPLEARIIHARRGSPDVVAFNVYEQNVKPGTSLVHIMPPCYVKYIPNGTSDARLIDADKTHLRLRGQEGFEFVVLFDHYD